MSEPSKHFPAHWNIKRCPLCRDEPFVPSMYGQVVRFSWFGLRKKVYAVICIQCKNIVGFDRGPPWCRSLLHVSGGDMKEALR